MVVAGGFIMLFGLLRVGKLGDFFPTSVIHGMLGGIGVIIMVKQFFVAMGTKSEAVGGPGLIGDILQIPHGFLTLNPYIALIAIVSIAIILIHPKIKIGIVQAIPAPMWVIIAAIPLGRMLNIAEAHTYEFMGRTYELGPQYLVQLPDNIMDGIVFPNFGKIAELAFWAAVMSIALVTTIETMLSALAVDTLDPHKRRTNLDKDVFGMGAGGAASGAIGGLPMISEIVRSSANISNGAKTQWSNFWHGFFLLIFLLFGKSLIDQIPLAALAAMLITVGFKLAAPKAFAHVLEIGKAQLFLFVLTLVTVVATDLLVGVATGIVAKMIIHLYFGAPVMNAFKAEIMPEKVAEGEVIRVKDAVIFSNFLSIKGYILRLDHETVKNITLDFREVNLIDHTVMSALDNLKKFLAERGQTLNLANMDHMTPVSEHPLATRLGI